MADMKPPKKGGKPKRIEAKGPPGGPYTPGARKGRPMPPKDERQRAATGAIRARRGLPQMLAQEGGDQETVEAAQLIESMPGGPELLYSYAIEQLMGQAGAAKKDAKKVRLYRIGGSVQYKGSANRATSSGVGSGGVQPDNRYQTGGLAKAAQRTREGGRGDDSVLLHMTPEEFEVIQAMWGPADVNPDTGMPEYGFLSKIWKKVKKAVKKVFSSKIFQIVAPIALSIFAPGLGTAVGNLLTGGGALGATASSVIGNAVVRGGMSAAGGGDFMTGAIQGAVSGGLGAVAGDAVQNIAPGLSDKTADLIGASLAGGTGAELTGGDFATGAITGGLQQMMQPTIEGMAEKGRGIFHRRALTPEEIEAGAIMAPKMTPEEISALETSTEPFTGTPQMSPIPEDQMPADPFAGTAAAAPATVSAAATPTTAPATTPTTGGGGGLGDLAAPLMLAGMAGGFGGGEYEEGQPPTPPASFEERLPLYASQREFIGPTDPEAYYQYGVAGAPVTAESLFVTPQPFAGEVGTPTAPTGGLEAAGTPVGQGIQGMIATGQIVPAQMAAGAIDMLRQAGYTPGPDGNFYPPGQQPLGQGTGFAMGGMHEQRFQRGGEFDYWEQNRDVPETIPTVSRQGGHHVRGPGTGRSDDIPARLSDGEYVIDAETVALLGDGSGSAGARRLDEMRRNLRKHKAKNLKKGQFTHKARSPEGYMPRLRAAAGRA